MPSLLPPTRLLLAAALTAAIALPGTALAGGGKTLSEACRADVTRLCPDAEGCEKKSCLKEHRAALSEACAADLARHKEARAAVKAACAPDRARLCGAAESKRDARACLRAHRDELSAPCADALRAMKAARHGAS